MSEAGIQNKGKSIQHSLLGMQTAESLESEPLWLSSIHYCIILLKEFTFRDRQKVMINFESVGAVLLLSSLFQYPIADIMSSGYTN